MLCPEDDSPCYLPECQAHGCMGGEEHDDSSDGIEEDIEADCGRWDQNAKGGMLPFGLCRLAGTEWCDWECPHSR